MVKNSKGINWAPFEKWVDINLAIIYEVVHAIALRSRVFKSGFINENDKVAAVDRLTTAGTAT